jgi:ribosomal RNA assembly protein
MIRSVHVPLARIGVLIGSKGSVKRKLQEKLGVRLFVSGNEAVLECEDALAIMTAENVVKAIGRGFSPLRAFRLLQEDADISIIDLPRDERELKRIRSRLIGEGGKARRNLERLTGCDVSVYGRTVAIIGSSHSIDNAKYGVMMLIKGFSHRSVWAWLEKRRGAFQKQNLA